MMKRCLLATLLALATGCERGAAPQPGGVPVAEPTGTPDSATALEVTEECVAEAAGYSVAYPAGWYVNTADVLGPCALFDPAPIEVPRDSEVPIEIAIMIDVEDVPFAVVADDVVGRREISREPTTVDGRPGSRILAETTGEGLYPPGIRFYQYVVDLTDRTLIAATYDAGSLAFERKRDVLDAMMTSFDLAEANAGA